MDSRYKKTEKATQYKTSCDNFPYYPLDNHQMLSVGDGGQRSIENWLVIS